MSTPQNVINFRSRTGYHEAVRKQQRDCQEDEAKPDPNDIIIADLKMLVLKSDMLLGPEKTNRTLPDRLLIVMAARQKR